MDAGKVGGYDAVLTPSADRRNLQMAEFDTPQNLLKNKESIFYSLVNEAGLVAS